MGSHSVTCHPTEVILPTLLPGIHQYSFYRPTEGGRPSRPRHCRKSAAARAQNCVSQSSWCQRLSENWTSSAECTTCEPLDALLPPKCITPHFITAYWSTSAEFTGYYDPGRLWRAGSQDINLSCRVPNYTFCCTVWWHSTDVTDRQTDGRHAHR